MDIHHRIETILESTGLTPNKVSQDLGKPRNWLSDTLSNRRSIDARLIGPMAMYFGVSPNFLCGFGGTVSFSAAASNEGVDRVLDKIADEVQKRLQPADDAPTIEQLISWWHRQNGILGDFDKIVPFVDLYHAPKSESKFIDPCKIGQRSLAARSFAVSSPEELAALLKSFPADLNLKVVKDHMDALRGTPKLSLEKIRVPLTHLGTEATFEYTRLLLPFRDQANNDYLLCYSRGIV
ncbi:MAG: hypothetical protein EP341_00370 [Sphingomonadales bacterium]|nr:MAG: hypothetical protein EP341_00370 [Sphingomonadales bacterium]